MMESGTNYAHLLYTQSLRHQYGGAPGRPIYDQDYASLSDPEIWDRVRRDPVCLAGIQLRVAQIVGDEYRVLPRKPKQAKPEEKRLAAIVEEGLDEIDDFDEARGELAGAFIRGSSWAWTEWEERSLSLDGTPEQLWRVPVRLRDIDRHRFELRRGEEPASAVWHLYSVARNAWEAIAPEDWANLTKVIYRDTEDALGYGRGVLEAIYLYLYLRSELLMKGMRGMDRLALGILHAKLDSLRDASGGKPNTATVLEWLDVLKRLRDENVLISGKEDDVSVINGPTEGQRLILDFVNYFDRAITRLLAGGTLTMGVSQDDAGSLAQSETHRQSGLDLASRDKRKVDGCITRDLIGQFLRLNRGPLARLGLLNVRSPRFSSASDTEDAAVQSTVAATLLGAGVPLRRDELYRKVGYTPPQAGDDIVEPRPAQPAGAGLPFGFGVGAHVGAPELRPRA